MTPANVSITTQGKKPLFSFGVITDIQYADIPDGESFLGIPRFYHHSVLVLRRAIKTWNDHNALSFALNFGDIVDGKCPKSQSLPTVKRMVNEFDQFDGPVHHMIGNHCLYNLPRATLVKLLKIPAPSDTAYYHFSPRPGFRIVVLDGYDVSALGRPFDHPLTMVAWKLLEEKNPNSDKNSPEGLTGLARRFLMFNGGVSGEQLTWLDKVLGKSTRDGEKVVVCCHVPLHPGCSSPEALLWNYDDVLEVIHRHGCVKVCIAGHDHSGGHCVDSGGVHHRVLEAALECPPGADAFGHVDVYHDRIEILGVDRMASMELVFRP
ncbi:manganese-dependent ADP-ribose/CDP-alcohol diphosphatase-like protein [Wolffia australiana]